MTGEPNKEGWADLAGMDRIDLLIIVLSVVVSTIAKYRHWLGDDSPGWLLDFVLPFGLIVLAYKVRNRWRARQERLERAKRWPVSSPKE
jgi:hypothetical protein